MKKFILFILLIVLVLMIVKPVHLNISHRHKTLAQRLELTTEQIKFEEILRAENRKESKPILIKIDKTSKEYKMLINKKASSKEIIAKKEELNNLSDQYNNIQKDHLLKFGKILNKTQKEKFKQLRTQLFLGE